MPRPSTFAPRAGSSRRSASEATRAVLLDHACELFGDLGYAATSLDAVVAAAGLTKGALYHHFRGKKDLFRAVFERTEHELLRSVREAAPRSSQDDRISQGLRLFLGAVSAPRYHRIVLHDGPSVLGPQVADPAGSPAFVVVVGLLGRVMPEWADDDVRDTLARFVFAACVQAARTVVDSDGDPAVLDRAERGLRVLLVSLRTTARLHAEPDLALAAPFVD